MDPSHCEETRAGCHNVPNQYYRSMIPIRSPRRDSSENLINKKHDCLLQASGVCFCLCHSVFAPSSGGQTASGDGHQQGFLTTVSESSDCRPFVSDLRAVCGEMFSPQQVTHPPLSSGGPPGSFPII